MCGRFSLTVPREWLLERYPQLRGLALEPRYNVAPSQQVPIVRPGREGGSEGALVRWGLIPVWAKEAKIGYRMINARRETVADKPAFKRLFQRRRCLVIADGFYEWERGSRQPHWIHRADGQAFAFAGLWDRWRSPEDEDVESCTIITTGANALLAPLHDRMPVVLDEAGEARWLAPEAPADALLALLEPRDWPEMTLHAVSRHVNNVRNEDPACIAPVA